MNIDLHKSPLSAKKVRKFKKRAQRSDTLRSIMMSDLRIVAYILLSLAIAMQATVMTFGNNALNETDTVAALFAFFIFCVTLWGTSEIDQSFWEYQKLNGKLIPFSKDQVQDLTSNEQIANIIEWSKHYEVVDAYRLKIVSKERPFIVAEYDAIKAFVESHRSAVKEKQVKDSEAEQHATLLNELNTQTPLLTSVKEKDTFDTVFIN